MMSIIKILPVAALLAATGCASTDAAIAPPVSAAEAQERIEGANTRVEKADRSLDKASKEVKEARRKVERAESDLKKAERAQRKAEAEVSDARKALAETQAAVSDAGFTPGSSGTSGRQ